MDHASDAHQQILLLLRASIRLEEMLEENKGLYCFPPAIADEFLQKPQRYLVLACAVGHYYQVLHDKKLFSVIPKFHFIWHDAYNARFVATMLLVLQR